MFEFENFDPSAKIKVFGIGGGGSNAVDSMIDANVQGVEFFVVNTDAQALARSKAPVKLQIGQELTAGRGAGADPHMGEESAREAEDAIREMIQGTDMLFITAGLGGGTGTGAAPVVAEIASSMDILTVAVVTRPFRFEGPQRMRRANEGLERLRQYVDTCLIVSNDKLLEVVDKKASLQEAFEKANEVLRVGLTSISDLISVPGLINVDYSDVHTIMSKTGGAVMGTGEGKGENRAEEAVRKACSSPLLEKVVIDGARGVLICVSGGPDMTLHEVNEATTMVYQAASPDANIIFGAIIDENLRDSMRVTIIATGFEDKQMGAGGVTSFEPPMPMPRPQSIPAPASVQAPAPEVAERRASGIPEHHVSQPAPAAAPAPAVAQRQVPITPAPTPVVAEQKPDLPPFLQKKRGLFD
ncbi:MAG: cell division protein FtsZ [Candidatus Sumerlaeales bacterium]|nr:cell division protein FtsZ [Candidatus Sumerlaeales bacterium]